MPNSSTRLKYRPPGQLTQQNLFAHAGGSGIKINIRSPSNKDLLASNVEFDNNAASVPTVGERLNTLPSSIRKFSERTEIASSLSKIKEDEMLIS